MTDRSSGPSRREFIGMSARIAAGGLIAGATGFLALRGGKPAADAGRAAARTIWEIDRSVCVQCGNCSLNCVLLPSAVKCRHDFEKCGYCKLCFGYFQPGAPELSAGAENEICPTGAIRRAFVEDPYFEYTIDQQLCIACGKCAKGCNLFGNGSLYLQIDRDLCRGCNECSIAAGCPSGAVRRVCAGFQGDPVSR